MLVAEGKGQVIGEAFTRPVALVEDDPGPFSPAAAADVLFGYAAGPAHGRGNAQAVNECCPTSQSGAIGDGSLLEDRRRRSPKLHMSKLPLPIENSPRNDLCVENTIHGYGVEIKLLPSKNA